MPTEDAEKPLEQALETHVIDASTVAETIVKQARLDNLGVTSTIGVRLNGEITRDSSNGYSFNHYTVSAHAIQHNVEILSFVNHQSLEKIDHTIEMIELLTSELRGQTITTTAVKGDSQRLQSKDVELIIK